MLWDLARATIGLQRSRDSAMEQLVFALENASVAAAKRDISVEKGDEVFFCPSGLSTPKVVEGISLGSCVDVLEAGTSSSSGFGDGGGVGGAFGSSGEMMGALPPFPLLASPEAFMKFSNPLRLGTRKLYAMEYGAGGGCPRM